MIITHISLSLSFFSSCLRCFLSLWCHFPCYCFLFFGPVGLGGIEFLLYFGPVGIPSNAFLVQTCLHGIKL